MKFFENGYNGGDGKFSLEMEGGKPGMWGGGGEGEGGFGFIMGGWEIFKVSLHSWQRGANPLIL